jgi:Xaa-Pro aminopeptidase
MGAKYEGYASDLTGPSAPAGRTDIFKKVYNTVLKAHRTALAMISEGVTVRMPIRPPGRSSPAAGYGEAFGALAGARVVGLAPPRAAPRRAEIGRRLSVDWHGLHGRPGIYLSGWAGVRIEDTVVMAKGKAKPLTKAVKANIR